MTPEGEPGVQSLLGVLFEQFPGVSRVLQRAFSFVSSLLLKDFSFTALP